MIVNKKTAFAAFLVLFVAFSLWLKISMRSEPAETGTNLVEGQQAPEFILTDVNGDSLSFQEIASENKVTLVNFWASWCGPCRLEMPAFERLYAEKKEQGFTILAINLDSDREKMEGYLRERPLGFTVLVDSAAVVSEEYGVKVLPTSVVVDRNRIVIRIIEGMQPSTVELLVNRELRKKR